jgi:hypothetical protein
MKPKTKADLQRKLTLAQVPKPPADLAERIKRDIPPHLVMGVSSERDRFTRSIFFDMRVAASVLLLVTSAFFAMQFFSHTDRANLARLEPRSMTQAPHAEQATLTAETERASAPAQVARFEPAIAPMKAELAKEKDRRRDNPVQNFLDARSAPREEEVASAFDEKKPMVVAEGTSVTASAPMLADAAAAAPAPVVAAPPPLPMAKQAASSGFFASASANEILPARSGAVFGISVDERAFERVKVAIEHGEQPESASIDVAALVNYFAGSAKRETHDVRLDVEGSPAPVISNSGRRMVRITIDTATADLAPGASVPPVATNASIDVAFDNSAVLAYHLVGGDGSLHSMIEPTLLKNTSVTALYDIVLAPRGTSWQRVAEFRLKYRSVTDGNEYTIARTLRRRDLEKSWIAASRRHRLASLGAVWGETLKGMAGANDVAKRAEELALQAPGDPKARELADVANATSQLHGTASGSSR